MGIEFTVLTVFVILASVLLTIVVLLQNSKGGGLASNFAVGNQTFGVRKTADILEKVTWGLVAFIFVISIVTTFATGGSGRTEVDVTERIENAASEQSPEFPAPVQQASPAQEAPATEAAPAE